MKIKTSILSRLFLAALPLSMMMSSCSSDDFAEEKNTFTLSGNASGAQEVPSVATPATATITGTYDRNARSLTYTVNWTGLSDSAIAAHFHGPADPGQNASVLIPLTITNPGPTGSATGTVSLTDSLAYYFLFGKIYYNVHTKLHPGGEIRSQVTLQER